MKLLIIGIIGVLAVSGLVAFMFLHSDKKIENNNLPSENNEKQTQENYEGVNVELGKDTPTKIINLDVEKKNCQITKCTKEGCVC